MSFTPDVRPITRLPRVSLSTVAVVLGTGLLIVMPYSGFLADRARTIVSDLGPVLLGLVATLAAL